MLLDLRREALWPGSAALILLQGLRESCLSSPLAYALCCSLFVLCWRPRAAAKLHACVFWTVPGRIAGVIGTTLENERVLLIAST